jgi:hypothetical protein
MSVRTMLLASLALAMALNAQEPIFWSENDPRCSHQYDKGLLTKAITENHLTVSVGLTDKGGHFELGVIVINGRATSIDILVENIAIWSATDKSKKIIHPLPLSKVVPKCNFPALNCESYAADIDAYIRWLNKTALASTTLGPTKDIFGIVFFPRENKKRNDVIVYLPIGGDTFEFQMSPQFQ